MLLCIYNGLTLKFQFSCLQHLMKLSTFLYVYWSFEYHLLLTACSSYLPIFSYCSKGLFYLGKIWDSDLSKSDNPFPDSHLLPLICKVSELSIRSLELCRLIGFKHVQTPEKLRWPKWKASYRKAQ